jgi:toxin ParE1/3/4
MAESLFGLRANKHIIFYRKIDEAVIEITRILHESMDLKNRFVE